MFFDTHTHLNDPKLYPDREQYLQNFINIGGKGLINIGVDKKWNERAIEIAKISKTKFENIIILSSIGYHPSEICFLKIKSEKEIKIFINEAINDLVNVYNKNKDYIYGIGECGIDVHYPNGIERLNYQKDFFYLQCELAEELNLPVIVHSRDDFESTFDILKKFKNLKIYFHCWGYGPEEIKKIINYFDNFWVGFAGNITYPKANNLRESIKILPLEKIVLETDAPYLTPQIKRGQTNYPENIKYIYNFVADFLNINLNILQNQMKENFNKLYIE